MATRLVDGQRTWHMSRDKDGWRTYKIKFRVVGETTDGPGDALLTPGLPRYGDVWNIDNEHDPWCSCGLEAVVTPYGTKEGMPSKHWDVEFTFSNKPENNSAKKGYEKPKTDQVDNPLQEPQKISGHSVKYQEEAVRNNRGFPIVNSAFELIRGPQVEFDANRHQIKIEQNVPLLQLELCTSLVDCVNGVPLWGLGVRRVKLSNFTWDVKYWQKTNKYFTRSFEFEIRNDGFGFDKMVLDEGTKVLNGHWDKPTGLWVTDKIAGEDPNPFNPQHFVFYTDKKGDMGRVVLNGRGQPAGVLSGVQDLYVSVELNNLDKKLTDGDFWNPMDDPTTIPSWDERKVYSRGNLVVTGLETSPQVWVCQAPVLIPVIVGDVPIITFDPESPDSVGLWFLLGKSGSVPVKKGIYSTLTTYTIGDYVDGFSLSKSTAGSIFVAKYLEADFTVLGIPLIL